MGVRGQEGEELRPRRPADDRKGDTWDHVAIDAESRLVISVVPGERTAENVAAVVEDFKRRTGGRVMDLITTDGYPAYEEAILDASLQQGLAAS